MFQSLTLKHSRHFGDSWVWFQTVKGHFLEIMGYVSSKTVYGRERTFLEGPVQMQCWESGLGEPEILYKKIEDMQVILTLATQSESQGIRKLREKVGQTGSEGTSYWENM